MTLKPCALALQLSQTLVRYPSVTPKADKTFQYIEDFLKPLGFNTHSITWGNVTNFYARWGTSGPHVCFAGHVDVVPAGTPEAWRFSPFSAHIQEGYLWGRGTADMKGAIACFMAAVHDTLTSYPPSQGSISFLLTSDEEGDAVHGLKRMVAWLQDHKEIPDIFLIGEPTGSSPGDEVKLGRRGSLTGHITFQGRQGHIASPQMADNPIPRLLSTLSALYTYTLDTGTDQFEPSRLEITSVDTGNAVMNLIPQTCQARFGIRFNTLQTQEGLTEWLRHICSQHAGAHTLNLCYHGGPFISPQDSGEVQRVLQGVTEAMGGQTPSIRNTGGTSDGRFLIALAPVVECGFPEDTIHAVDERIKIEDIYLTKKIYLNILRNFFKI